MSRLPFNLFAIKLKKMDHFFTTKIQIIKLFDVGVQYLFSVCF
jgi:hypothetical protein